MPRPGADPGDHWYSYVAGRVAAGAVLGLTGAEVRALAGDDADAAGSLLVVGHEDAASTIRVFLSSLPTGRATAGVLLVAPPSADGDWHAAGCLRVLLSRDETERAWAEAPRRRGGGPARGARRFYGAHEVSVLINLAALALEVAEANG